MSADLYDLRETDCEWNCTACGEPSQRGLEVRSQDGYREALVCEACLRYTVAGMDAEERPL